MGAHLLLVRAARGREQKVVEVQRCGTAVARLTEGIRPVRVCGNSAVGAAEVGRDYILRRREC